MLDSGNWVVTDSFLNTHIHDLKVAAANGVLFKGKIVKADGRYP